MSVLVVLGLIWAAVLIPPVLRARAERRVEFIDSFQEQMGALGSGTLGGRTDSTPAPRPRVPKQANPVKRRRDILGGLLGAMIGSLVLGMIPRLRVVLVFHLLLLNLFLGYVALLAHQRDLTLRRQAHVRPRGVAVPRQSARSTPSAPRPAPRRALAPTPAQRPAPALARVLHTSVSSRR